MKLRRIKKNSATGNFLLFSEFDFNNALFVRMLVLENKLHGELINMMIILFLGKYGDEEFKKYLLLSVKYREFLEIIQFS